MMNECCKHDSGYMLKMFQVGEIPFEKEVDFTVGDYFLRGRGGIFW